MKVAVAASGKTLESLVDPRFGRAAWFLVVTLPSEEVEVVENAAREAVRGAGIGAAQQLVDAGVKAVIAGNFGPNAARMLRVAGVKVYAADPRKTVRQALVEFKAGRLAELALPPAGGGWGRGRRGGW